MALSMDPGRNAPRSQRTFALLNAQWRGGSTLAEQLLFSTTIASPFLLDEPAKAVWQDGEHHTAASANFNAFRCNFHQVVLIYDVQTPPASVWPTTHHTHRTLPVCFVFTR